VVTPDRRMAVGKIQTVTELCRWRKSPKINPEPRGRVADKKPIVNAALVLIQHHPDIGRARISESWKRKARSHRRWAGSGPAPVPVRHEMRSSHSADGRDAFAINHHSFVRGAIGKSRHPDRKRKASLAGANRRSRLRPAWSRPRVPRHSDYWWDKIEPAARYYRPRTLPKRKPCWRRLERQVVCWALIFALTKTGNKRAARIAMVAMTANSSRRVKPSLPKWPVQVHILQILQLFACSS